MGGFRTPGYSIVPLYSWVILALIATGCISGSGDVSKAGVAISFDDHFIEDWYALKPLFDRYDAKVTFFITCPDSLTTREIRLLKELESDGHEIGFHGTIHGRATEMIAAHGPEGYIETELTPGLGYMRAAGFYPTSYAHPGGNHNSRVDSVLLAQGFQILRDVALSRREYKGVPLYQMAPRIMPWIYYSFDQAPIVDALSIDMDARVDIDSIKEAMEKAKNTGTALMLFGHQPLQGKAKQGQYGFDIGLLEGILKEAKIGNLKFYRMSDLVKN